MAQSIDPAADGWARPVSRRDRLVDAGIAVLLLACTGVTIPLTETGSSGAPLWFDIVWAVSITAPLAWRRRFPSAAAVAVTAVFLIGQLTVMPEPLVSQIAPFIGLYTAGAWGGDRRRSVVVRGILVAAIVAFVVVAIATAPARLPQQVGNLSGTATLGLAALSSAIYLAAAIAFGETAWRSARGRAALELRTAELQAERERTAEQAVALERVRIARELHDVVAHHVSVIGIQAGAARRVLATAPDRAAGALEIIEQNARQAIEDLHSTVVALRSNDAPAPPSTATSTLGVEQLPTLVADAQRAGTPTALTVIGDPCRLPPTTGLTLYRVAQEALTNVRKHAGPGARADVRLRYGAGAVELEVGDTGGAGAPASRSPGGMGQLGMRERVAAVGGTFEAGPDDRGYLVRVGVPLPR